MTNREKRLQKEKKNDDNVIRVINKWLDAGYNTEIIEKGIFNKMGRIVEIKDNTIRLWGTIDEISREVKI